MPLAPPVMSATRSAIFLSFINDECRTQSNERKTILGQHWFTAHRS